MMDEKFSKVMKNTNYYIKEAQKLVIIKNKCILRCITFGLGSIQNKFISRYILMNLRTKKGKNKEKLISKDT